MSTLAVAVVGALLALSVPSTAQAAGVVSQGNGRLLTAFLGGSSLDSLAALNGADAVDPFGLGNVTADVPLDATALSALNLAVSGVNLFGSPGIIQLGAVGQYGGANNDASSVAFSGTVSQAPSLVGVGTTVTGSNVGTPGAGDSATINVGTNQILGGTNLVQLGVDVGAVAASASQTPGGVQSGNYVISNLNVVVGGTVLGTTITSLNTLLTPTLNAVNALVTPAIVNPLAGGQVTINLTDLLAVAGVANVNALPAGTNLLTYLPAAVTAKVTSIVNNLLGSLQTAVTGLGLAGLAAQALLTTAQTAITPILTGLTGTLNGPLGTAVNALLQLDVNNQSTVAGAFTQNALTIGIGANGGLARVGLANATVGPNAGLSGVTPVITGITPNTGSTAGGTPVTITGTGFTGSTGVTFDGLPATSVVVVNDTTITAVSPAHAAGAVDVVVQNPAADSAPGTFTYVPPPAITNITPVTGPTAGGTAVTITGTGFTGSTGVTFGGLPATSVVVVNDTTITAVSPAHAAGLVNVVVQNPVGNSGPFGFTYVAPPAITGITPTTGPTAGGTAVTITGTGFTGSTGVTFGGTAATSVVVVSDTTVTAVSPAHAAGAVNVVVENPIGNSGPFGFTYVAPPASTGITPNTGPTTGGTAVTITGTGFTGSTGVTFGGVPATSVVVVNDTTITAISPAHAAGLVNVVVQNPVGNSGPLGFTYVAPPVLAGITPNTGPTAGGTAVTISGTGFTGSTGVTFGGVPATSVVVVNDTTITAVSPAHAAGLVNVVVQNPVGNSGPLGFTYVAPPAITGLTPNSGPTAGGTAVTITGTGFTGSTGVTFGGVAATSVVVVTDTTITAISPAHAPGPVSVIVQNPVGNSAPAAFTYVAPPAITAITPNTGPESGGTAVTITGTGFTGSTGVTFGGVPATSVVVVNDTTITAVSPAHAAGAVNVVVQNPVGNSAPAGFTYTPLISITGVSPNSGPTAGGTSVTITGTCFTGATGVSFGGVAGTAFTVVDDSHITVTSPSHVAGAVDVVVDGSAACGGPTTSANGFTYIAPNGPVVVSLTPTSGPASGGTTVTITGTNLGGATGVTFDGTAGTNFTAVNGTTIMVDSPPHAVGAVSVVVQTPLGPSAPLTFTYVSATVTAVDPGTGPEVGGTGVTITGTCFTGATGVLFGTTHAASFRVLSDTEITAVSPSGAGTVDITVVGSPNCGNGTLASAFRYVSLGLALTGTAMMWSSLVASLLLLVTGAGLILLRRRRNGVTD